MEDLLFRHEDIAAATAHALSRPEYTYCLAGQCYCHEEAAQTCARFIVQLFPDHLPATSQTALMPSLTHFVAHILHQTSLHASVTYGALYLLNRLKDQSPTTCCMSHHGLFISTFMIAAKIFHNPYVNRPWCAVVQGLYTLSELNQMERDMCGHLGWYLGVPVLDFAIFKTTICNTFGSASTVPIPPTIPQTPTCPTSTPSPSPHLLPPNSLGPSASGYPNGGPVWEGERNGREHKREREARDREPDRDSHSSCQRQPSGADRVKVEILNQQPPNDRFFPGRGRPTSPVAFLYDPCRSPPPAERVRAEGRPPYMAPPQSHSQYAGHWDRACERERGAHTAPSRQPSPTRDTSPPSSSRRYDPRMDIDQGSPRREYWPKDQAHPPLDPIDRVRYSATPDSSRLGNRSLEVSAYRPESLMPGGSPCIPPSVPVVGKTPADHEMSAPASRAPASAPASQVAPQHHTFKVTLGGNNALPPPAPGPANEDHHRSQPGSNGSTHGLIRSRATSSPAMASPRQDADEDCDEAVVDPLMGFPGLRTQSMQSRTASIHSVASPVPHGPPSMGREGRHEAFAPPVTRSQPVLTTRPSLSYRPASSIAAHGSPHLMHSGTSNRTPPSSFSRRGSEQTRDKMALSLKRVMDDEGSGPLEKRTRVEGSQQVSAVFPPPTTDTRPSPGMGLGCAQFNSVLSSAADSWMETDSPSEESAFSPIAVLSPPHDPPDSPDSPYAWSSPHSLGSSDSPDLYSGLCDIQPPPTVNQGRPRFDPVLSCVAANRVEGGLPM
ncbi:unnamed protein product [Rhizoctonia solani]|uniref:Cyclin N-terminal domain-containing protein n=1 Tax=Rhizoctonia solani TaxID=456999 RepID=A0A8H2XRZ4_9AGAM|nr:unnamed protein product [Rhizoctonia solani]